MSEFNISANCYPSPFQTEVDGTLILTVAPNALECKQIELVFEVGDTDDSLFSANQTHKPTVGVNDSKWVISGPLKPVEDPPSRNKLSQAYSLENKHTGSKVLTEPLVIRINGLVNNIWGTAEVTVCVNDTEKECQTFKIVKSPAALYLRNFITRADTAANIPITEFSNKSNIYFSWESNGTNYKLYNGRSETPVYDGSDTSFLLEGGISRDTTFILIAEYSDGINKLTLIDRIGLTVSNPCMTVAGIDVEEKGYLNFQRDTTVHILGSITANGSIIVQGALCASKITGLESVSSDGGLKVAGNSNFLSDVMFHDDITVKNGTTLTGATSFSGNATFNAEAAFAEGITVHNKADFTDALVWLFKFVDSGKLQTGYARKFEWKREGLMFFYIVNNGEAVIMKNVSRVAVLRNDGDSCCVQVSREDTITINVKDKDNATLDYTFISVGSPKMS